ncbi:MAG: metallophosphatase family protein [Spirochaetota bacterium]|nr:metallophosphatase family protein [Spirochaetota bacterium]
MKYAIISDIHSNLEAFKSVLEDIDKQKADRIICLGDVIGYATNPNECCELLFERTPIVIKGNHDYAGCDLKEIEYFNIYAQESARWTYNNLSEKNRKILSSLKDFEIVDNNFLVLHGALTHRNNYIINLNDAEENFAILKRNYPHYKICFYGHTHSKQIWGPIEGTPATRFTPPIQSFQLLKKDFYLINPGSVGQPRDRDPRASYLIFDSETMKITYNLLEYDVETTKRKILSARLPSYLANRLDSGV